VHPLEVAVGELVPPLGLFTLVVILTEVPFCVLAVAVLFQEVVFLLG